MKIQDKVGEGGWERSGKVEQPALGWLYEGKWARLAARGPRFDRHTDWHCVIYGNGS